LPEQARELGAAALGGLGYSAEEADIIVDQLVDNALSGYTFAGLSRILAIEGEPKLQQPRRPISIVSETENSALIDGGNNVGYLAVSRAADVAIEKAQSARFAVVGVYDSWYSGRNAYFVERLARADLVAIHTASAKPRVAPLGGARPALGTNPISLGFPSARGPVVFDMGTASIMWGDLLMMARLGEELPEGIALDAEGRATRDAAAAVAGAVLPFAGHKGYGLSFAVQALGLLAGAAIPRNAPQDYGFLFIAFDPGLTVPLDEFKRLMSELVDNIKATPRQQGVEEILVPSERAYREREKRRESGFAIDRKLFDRLSELAERR
jgi:LDH2 family malate/lactate/ureidoglycolate dehydrogenase